jgi:NAD(P)-dependent dehydrogenase (short-subunit alcohol dehydrogenase family)
MTDTAILPPIPKVALVTGAAKRIGRMIALALAEDGYAIGVHYNNSAKDADATLAAIERKGAKGIALKADLAIEAEVATLVPRVTKALGPLGVLVNNASLFDRDEAKTVTRQSWDAHMEANLRAPFVLIQALAAQLPAASEGVVVNMLDERVLNLTPHFVSYTVSKAGLWTLTQTMALALAPRVRVIGIGPGPTMPSPRQSQGQFDRQAGAMPLKRGAAPEEVAAAVRFILAARSMTGSILMLDGGQHLAWSTSSRETPE